MRINSETSSENQAVKSLFYFMGEALYTIQDLEGALCTSITLKVHVKRPGLMSKQVADHFREKNYEFTLGDAIKAAKKNNLYSEEIFNDLEVLKKERNWLIHKLLHKNIQDMDATATREKLFFRIKSISNKAKMLQGAIEANLIEYSESVGVDMSRVRADIEKYSNMSPY